LAFHYRAADPELVGERLRELRERLRAIAEARGLELTAGAKVLEVRPSGLSKALVAQRVLAMASPEAALVAIGDDQSDEELFAALPPRAVSVFVGRGRTRATFRAENVSAVRALIRDLSTGPSGPDSQSTSRR
jgi:trehalose 6-phosphate synthase/phosphatase